MTTRRDGLSMIGLAVLPALASGCIAYAAAVARLEAALQLRPPLAVVDYGLITDRLAQGSTPKALEPVFKLLKDTSGRLRDHGYLVLNRIATDAVPDPYLIPAPLTAGAFAALPAAPHQPQPTDHQPDQAITSEEAAAVIHDLTTLLAARP